MSPSTPIATARSADLAPRVDLALGLGPSIQAATVNQLAAAGTTIAEVDAGAVDGGAGFGAALRSLERVVALNRLVRQEVGRRAHREERAVLRHCLARLDPTCSWLRRVAALDELADQYGEALTPTAFSVTRAWLVDQCDHGQADLSGQATVDLSMTIGAARSRYAGWNPDHGGSGKRAAGRVIDDLDPILGELSRTYAKGRKALRRAYSDSRARDFRRWHRRVRRFGDQLILVESLDPTFIGAHRSLLGRLDTLLEHHTDLVELGSLVRDDPRATADERERTLLLVLIERARVELRWEARPLGLRAYAEEPAAFTARLEAYWHAGRSPL